MNREERERLRGRLPKQYVPRADSLEDWIVGGTSPGTLFNSEHRFAQTGYSALAEAVRRSWQISEHFYTQNAIFGMVRRREP